MIQFFHYKTKERLHPKQINIPILLTKRILLKYRQQQKLRSKQQERIQVKVRGNFTRILKIRQTKRKMRKNRRHLVKMEQNKRVSLKLIKIVL